MPSPMALGGIFRERFKQESRNCTRLLGTISLTNLPYMTSLAASSRLQNAIVYCTKVLKTIAAGNDSNNLATVYIESPTFTWTSMLTYSSATPKIMSAATSSFGSNCSIAAFCFACQTSWWASCFNTLWIVFYRQSRRVCRQQNGCWAGRSAAWRQMSWRFGSVATHQVVPG